jgi:hypothetical protein
VRLDDGHHAGAPERRPPGDQLVEDDTQRVHVRAGVRAPAPGLLGRHVGGRPDPLAGARQPLALVVDEARQAEVQQLDDGPSTVRAAREEDVGGLQVAVDDALAVRERQRVADRFRDASQPGHVHRTAGLAGSGGHVRQARALEQLHDEVRPDVRLLAEVGHLDDVRVAQAAGRAGLALEAAGDGRVAHQGRPQHLDGEGRRQPLVLRTVDGAEAATADGLQQPVASTEQRPDERVLVRGSDGHGTPSGTPRPARREGRRRR